MDFDGYCELSSDDEDTTVCCSHHYSSDSGSDDDDGDLSAILQYSSANRAKQQAGEYCTADAVDEPDPFEEELAGELDQAMLQLRALDGSTGSWSSKPSATGERPSAADSACSGSSSAQPQRDQPKHQYDSIYFDSDEDDEDEGVQRRRATQSDADLLYDPSLDDRDQQWMDEHRASAHRTGLKRRDRRDGKGGQSSKHQKTKAGKSAALPDSDAVLNCPGCLTMLCADCQRHAIYSTQFRAMFVFSCKVDYTQLLRFPAKLTKKEIWKNKKLERKMRQAMKKNEQEGKGSLEDNSVDSAAVVKEETLIKKDEGDETTEMECNASSNDSKNVSESCGEGSNEGGTPVDGEPAEETNSTVMLSNDDKEIQDELKSSPVKPVKKVRFETGEKDGSDEEKSKAASESSVAGGCASVTAGAGGVGGPGCASVPAGGGGLLQAQDEELFHPVMCRHCNTKVAVLDRDEVYHFFNVITSY